MKKVLAFILLMLTISTNLYALSFWELVSIANSDEAKRKARNVQRENEELRQRIERLEKGRNFEESHSEELSDW